GLLPDDRWLAAFTDIGLAMGSMVSGNPSMAASLLEPLCRQSPGTVERQLHGFAFIQRALALFLVDEYLPAHDELAAATTLAVHLGNARQSTGCCELAAYLTAADAQYELAAWLIGAAMNGREITGAPLLPHWLGAHAATHALLGDKLGASRWEAVIARGRRSMPLENAALLLRIFATP